MDVFVEPPSPDPGGKGLYASADEALRKVTSEFEYWSGKLTETSLQMCYAIIGANWVVFGSVNGIFGNQLAKWSIVLVLLAMGSSVLGTWIMSELMRRRIGYGEGAPEKWAKEYAASIGKDVAWPFTDAMQNLGKYMRWIKAMLTLASGICLIIGAILK
jgi:hypothetical protein